MSKCASRSQKARRKTMMTHLPPRSTRALMSSAERSIAPLVPGALCGVSAMRFEGSEGRRRLT